MSNCLLSKESSSAEIKIKTYDLPRHHHPYSSLFLHYHCGFAAERQERRHIGGVWRAGQPDGIRPAGRGQRAFQGDHLVGGGVYDHFDYIVGLCQPA